MKPREWTITELAGRPCVGGPVPGSTERITVREVLPDTVTLTYEQLSAAMREACPDAWGNGSDEGLWRLLTSTAKGQE